MGLALLAPRDHAVHLDASAFRHMRAQKKAQREHIAPILHLPLVQRLVWRALSGYNRTLACQRQDTLKHITIRRVDVEPKMRLGVVIHAAASFAFIQTRKPTKIESIHT